MNTYNSCLQHEATAEIGARLGPDWVLAIKMYGNNEILSVQISETKHAIQLEFSTQSVPNEY